jgi:ATP-binding cassette subfamily B protein
MAVRVLLRYLAGHRARYGAGLSLLVVTTLSALAIPWVVKDTIEAMAAGLAPAVGSPGRAGAARTVAAGALLVVALASVQGVTRIGSRLALLGAGQRVEARIRDDVFRQLLLQPPSFYQGQRTGDLMSRSTNDLQNVTALIGFGFLSLVSTCLVYGGTLVAMVRLDPALTVAALAPYPLLIALAKRFNSRVHAETLAVQEQLSALSARTQENLAGMAVVRAYTMEDAEVASFRGANAELLGRVLRQARTQGAFVPLMGLIGGLGSLVVLWLGGRAVMEGRLSLGALVAFSTYLAYLAWPTMALGWVLAIVRRGLTAMGRIVEILDTVPAIGDGQEASGPIAFTGAIELRDLTFAYEGDRAPALRHVSLRVPAGTWIAVVGPTGAGKTTLAALLPRLWDPPPGTVFLDGHEIHTIPLADLRRAIGYVPQESFLFSRPLGENVTFGESAARRDQAGAAAGLSADVARLPDGWDTVVGERGLTLSGGQRQRAALARALARDPRILILDDAFASVDALKEAEILAGLRDTVAGRTAILITHRLQAARIADRVVVLAEGRIVEEGTHAELLRRDGLYARLWRRQQLAATVAAVP